MLTDNGIRDGKRDFGVMELLKRVDDMRSCYELDLYEMKCMQCFAFHSMNTLAVCYVQKKKGFYPR
jgi:hypothetical protein